MSVKLIGITGGIGSGKSVVARICKMSGYQVYDCDSQAKRIMDESDSLKTDISKITGYNIFNVYGEIDRKLLAEVIFNDKKIRSSINSLVHGYVRDDIVKITSESVKKNTLFVESAIMHVSKLDRMMNEIWVVDAPIDIRVKRVQERSGLNVNEILLRINSQKQEYECLECNVVKNILNDNNNSLLLQINTILSNS